MPNKVLANTKLTNLEMEYIYIFMNDFGWDFDDLLAWFYLYKKQTKKGLEQFFPLIKDLVSNFYNVFLIYSYWLYLVDADFNSYKHTLSLYFGNYPQNLKSQSDILNYYNQLLDPQEIQSIEILKQKYNFQHYLLLERKKRLFSELEYWFNKCERLGITASEEFYSGTRDFPFLE